MPEIFTTVVDCIFKNKPRGKPNLTYNQLTDDDKEVNFFMINRKFGYKHIEQAEFFNKKGIDKATAMDIWYMFFKNQKGTPGWYWQSSTKKKTAKAVSKTAKENKELIMRFEDISEEEYDFLEKYYKKELNAELRKLKKYEL